MKRIRVSVIGNENNGWALDTDARLAKTSLKENKNIKIVKILPEYYLCVSPLLWYKKCNKKKFIAAFPGNPKRLFENDPLFLHTCYQIPCIAQTKEAYDILKMAQIPNISYIPYVADLQNFYSYSNKDKESIRKKLGIPNDKFVIGNFMRDSLGADIHSIKNEKGADIFCEIIKGVCKRLNNDDLCVLLAGPRRHWIREHLEKIGVDYVFVGKEMEQDDFNYNVLSEREVNALINVCDLILVSSRSEGGPRAILETIASKTAIISSPVGLAKDVLKQESIYYNILQAQEMILQHYKTRYLNLYCDELYENVVKMHSYEEIGKKYNLLFSSGMKIHKVHIGKKQNNTTIAVVGFETSNYIERCFLEIVKGKIVKTNFQRSKVDILIECLGKTNEKMQEIQYRRKMLFVTPQYLKNLRLINIHDYDGVIYFDDLCWFYQESVPKSMLYQIVLPKFKLVNKKPKQKIKMCIDGYQKHLVERLRRIFAMVDICIAEDETENDILKSDILIFQHSIKNNPYLYSLGTHSNMIILYNVNNTYDKQFFDIASWGYKSEDECICILSYVIDNYTTVLELARTKTMEEVKKDLFRNLKVI